MYNDKKIKDKVIRRVVLLGGVQTVLFSLIFGRLYKLQIVDHEKYRTQSDKNRISFLLHAPNRGIISDSSGNLLATNKEVYSLYLYPYLLDDIDKTIFDLSKIINMGEEDKKHFYGVLKKHIRKDKPILLKNFLSWQELSTLSVNKNNIKGLEIKSGFIREYNEGIHYAHIIGYTSKDNINKNPVPEMLIGKMGIEKYYDNYLKGIPGSEEIEVNANGNHVRRLSIKESITGSDIQLTINSDLQRYVSKRIDNYVGSIVLMDANNGNILSSVSNPSFDPNVFSKPLGNKDWNNLLNNKDSPLINRSFKGLYPPGSTFKPVIALAALKHNLIRNDEKIFCNGTYKLGNRNFHCWKKGGHGNLNMESAISESCDVFFYELALRLGIEKISNMAKELGFGNFYNEYFGKSNGIIPDKKWKKSKFNESWQKGETLNVGIGQGFLLVTPLELAVMTSNIANMGKMITPNIIKSVNGQDINNEMITSENGKLISSHLAVVKQGMFKVMNNPKGTAWKSRIDDNEYLMAGKTGTSQVRIISSEEREKGIIKNEDLPKEKRDHALFIGFAPYNKPRFVTVVILENAGGGSKYAAPVGKDVLLAARKYILGKDLFEDKKG